MPRTDEEWDAVVLDLVRHQASTADRLARLLTLDERWVPALCLRGFALLFSGRRALRAEALEWAVRARGGLAEGSEGGADAHLVEALECWALDDLWGAEAALQARLREDPRDGFTVKLQHGLLFMMGQPEAMRGRLEAILPAWNGDEPLHAHLLGCLLFARVECGDLPGAREIEARWLEAAPHDPWGLHGVAHRLHEAGDFGEALGWLDERQAQWAGCDRFGNHLDWHRALLRLRLGDGAGALGIFDQRLRGVFDGNYRDMSNAVSILWRLQARGIDVGERWRELAEASVVLVDDHGSAFADAHYVLAQLHGGSAAGVDALLRTLPHPDVGPGYQAQVVARVGAPLCHALAGWLEDPQVCLIALRQLDADLVRLGGSQAQRSLFADIREHLACQGA